MNNAYNNNNIDDNTNILCNQYAQWSHGESHDHWIFSHSLT